MGNLSGRVCRTGPVLRRLENRLCVVKERFFCYNLNGCDMAEKGKKDRPRVALLLSQLVGRYSEVLWPAAVEAAEQKDVDLLILPGETPRSPYGFEYQNGVIYDLLTARNCDALIIAAGTLCNYMSTDEFNRYFRRFQKFTAVTLGMKMPGLPAVLVDNRAGVLETVNHLAGHHGYERIAYVSGSDSNAEARDRKDAFLEGLKKNGLRMNPELMYQGDFSSHSGKQAMQHFLKSLGSNLDAVVCANDDTAMGVLDVLEEKGIRVPRDMAVAAFDNIEEVRFHPYCPLTTVSQPIREQAFEAMNMVLDLLDGKKVPESVVLPTKLVVRSSCGCLSESIELADETAAQEPKTRTPKTVKPSHLLFDNETDRKKAMEWSDKILAEFERPERSPEHIRSLLLELNQAMTRDIRENRDVTLWQSVVTLALIRAGERETGRKLALCQEWVQEARVLVGEKMQLQQAQLRLQNNTRLGILMNRVVQNLIANLTVDDLMNTVASEFPLLGIRRCFVSLYPKPVNRDRADSDWVIPREIGLVMAYNEYGRLPLRLKSVRYQTMDILPREFFDADRRVNLILLPLFFREEQFGLLVMELGWRLGLIYGTLQMQLSTALKAAGLSARKPGPVSAPAGRKTARTLKSLLKLPKRKR